MYSKRISIALVSVALTAGCGWLPAAPGTTNVENPPAYVNVVRSDKVNIQLVPQAASNAARNQHPAAFQPDQVRALIGSLRLATVDDGAVTLTSPARMKSLVAGLSKAFAQAGPRQDVAFAIFRDGGGLFSSTRHLTSGRMFYQNAILNIIFGALDKEVSPFRKFTAKNFNYGQRAHASAATTQALIAAPSWHYHGDRRDWVEMPATKAAIAAAGQAVPEIIESTGAGRSSSSFDYGPAAASPATPVAPEPSPAQVPQTPGVVVTPPAAATPLVAPGNGWAHIEERLTQLKRLRDEDLISADDYQNKKDALLRQLP